MVDKQLLLHVVQRQHYRLLYIAGVHVEVAALYLLLKEEGGSGGFRTFEGVRGELG